MTIDEAIKILTSANKQFRIVGEGNFKEATQLGIEALKRVLDVRRFPEAANWRKLPGEAE